MRTLLQVAVIPFVLIMTISCMHDRRESEGIRIVNATSATVLDGGSYAVVLSFADKSGLHLFIANPTRRKGQGESVWIANENGEPKQVLQRTALSTERLKKQLSNAKIDPQVSVGTRSICSMLERLLTNPDMPWDQVIFVEKWE